MKKNFQKIIGNGYGVRGIIAFLFILLAIYFIRHEHREIKEVKDILLQSNPLFVGVGLVVTGIYILLQSGMYYYSFASIRHSISLSDALKLFLRRNLIGTFLPGGNITSQMFFTGFIEKKKISRTQIHLASVLYLLSGFITVFMVVLPAIVYLLYMKDLTSIEKTAAIFLLIVALLFILLIISVLRKGVANKLLHRYLPDYAMVIDELTAGQFSNRDFLRNIFCSLSVEITGILQLIIAMTAIGVLPSAKTGIIGYATVLVVLMASPVIKGVGTVEVALTIVLHQFGMSTLNAVSTALMFRFFEFVMPLVAGVFSFFISREHLGYRIFPPVLIFMLGLVNIFSVLTPPISERLHAIENIFPVAAIAGSNYTVIAAGVVLLLLSVALFKGLRVAWVMAVTLSILSIIGHLTKALDYEEALFAAFTLVVLLVTGKQYRLRGDRRFRQTGVIASLALLIAIIIYGVTGFYFLDQTHFGIDFSLLQSIKYTFDSFFLFTQGDLIPQSIFARRFLDSINFLGTSSVAFLLFTLIKPFIKKEREEEERALETAKQLVKKYGNSTLDYFKTYYEKDIFLTEDKGAFIAYRTADDYAVALELPVAENDVAIEKAIKAFEQFCKEKDLIPVYYRVPEDKFSLFRSLNKKSVRIGQEAIVDIAHFTMEGGDKKSLRNAVSKIEKAGYVCKVYEPPLKDGLLQKLKLISDEWLSRRKMEESVFSQGKFLWEEIKNQTVLVVENTEEKAEAFLNIIPDYATGEGTYDLQRMLNDAPNGVMDFLFIKMFDYLKTKSITKVNLGMVPMSGNEQHPDSAEVILKFLYRNLPRFAHYKGLREYKEKFSPEWKNTLIVFNHNYDLIQMPQLLKKVMKP